MFISDTDYKRKRLLRNIIAFIPISALCGLFSFVYETFSHGVYSNFMIYAFTVPLAGAAVLGLTAIIARKHLPSRLTLNLFNSAVATLTVASLIRGVLDIYGTTNILVFVYPVVSVILFTLAIIAYIVQKKLRA